MNIEHLRSVLDEPDLSATKYRLVEFLDAGGMGSVYVAEDTDLERRVALKVLRLPDSGGDLTARMIREAKIVARLEHPGIVPIHDIGRLPDGRPYYVSKLVTGKRLDLFARERHSIAEKLRVFQRVCDAVAFAHNRGIIHRDLKPQNIIIGEFGEVLVLDWGVAKVHSQIADVKLQTTEGKRSDVSNSELESATRAGVVIGTPGFMAPEQERGEIADERSDIYSLGATLLALLSGDGSPNKLPKPLAAICRKATALAAANRYGSVTELVSDIARYLDRLQVTAYRENLLEKTGRWVSKNWFVVILIASYFLARLITYLLYRS